MKEPINLISISSLLRTSYHVKEVQDAIEQLETAFFKKNQNFIVTLEQDVPFPLSENLKQLAKDHEVSLENTAEANDFLIKVQEAIQQLPRLTLTLSFMPTLSLIKEINRWIILNVKQTVVLDFMLDKDLIAGAKIAFKGKLKDYSIKKRMEGTIQTMLST
jgi:F0F1-type ATP synthase delta subunit